VYLSFLFSFSLVCVVYRCISRGVRGGDWVSLWLVVLGIFDACVGLGLSCVVFVVLSLFRCLLFGCLLMTFASVFPHVAR